jgi:membrane protease YdiL (CAAX protease family)
VGFEFVFDGKYFLVVLLSWLAIVALIMAMFYPAGAIEYVGYGPVSFQSFQKGFRGFMKHLFYVGIFEELIFRGIFQNLLAQKFKTFAPKNIKAIFICAGLVSIILGVIAAFSVKSGNKWFLPLVTATLFISAYAIEKRYPDRKGEYLVLAIICAIFGIVHFHVGKAGFMGLATLAGWFYGYVYIKTKNVFYAGLLHVLVNCSSMFLVRGHIDLQTSFSRRQISVIFAFRQALGYFPLNSNNDKGFR